MTDITISKTDNPYYQELNKCQEQLSVNDFLYDVGNDLMDDDAFMESYCIALDEVGGNMLDNIDDHVDQQTFDKAHKLIKEDVDNVAKVIDDNAISEDNGQVKVNLEQMMQSLEIEDYKPKSTSKPKI